MQASEIREMTDSDIQARITELQEERFRLRFRGATETLEDPLRLRGVRRDIARALTVLRERQLAGEKGAAKPSKAAGQSTRRGPSNAAKAAR